jgi:hypothetical protein
VETVEYVDDAAAAGLRKALIPASHITSEQAVVDWLKFFLSEVPLEVVLRM